MGMAIIFAVATTASVRDTKSDPYQQLLISQSILEHGTIDLTLYNDDVNLIHIRDVNGQKFNFFPIGTALFSTPFVFALNQYGFDMRHNDQQSQVIILSITGTLLFLVIYLIGTHYVSNVESFIITLIGILGSSLTSTLATALWSHNYAAIFIALSILILIKIESNKSADILPFALGFMLFSSYLCRPISAVFVASVLAYLLFTNRYAFIKTSFASLVLMLGFIWFSLHTYDNWLPSYYLPSRLSSETYWTALVGLVVSPSRGVFVYSPFLILAFSCAVLLYKPLSRFRLYYLACICPFLYLLAIAKFPDWYGSHSYGPRYQSDFFVLYIVIVFMIAREFSTGVIKKHVRICTFILFMILGLMSVWINAYQGLHNKWTQVWNENLSTSDNKHKLIFDWSSPQFLASGESITQQAHENYGKEIYGAYTDEKNYTVILYKLNPVNSVEFIGRGDIFARKGNYDEAMKDFNQSITMNPFNATAYIKRGLVYKVMGKTNDACKDLKVACDIGRCESLRYATEKGICKP